MSSNKFHYGNLIITGSLMAQSITGSLLGSASYAVTASYALNAPLPFPFTGDAEVTGSIIVKAGSASTDSIFLIKNYTNTTVFSVSQSGVIILATQSIELNNPAPNGGIYFTSNSLFIGLD